MKAIVYGGPGKKSWTDVLEPSIVNPSDAIVRVDTTTICGTDLHILTADVPAVQEGRSWATKAWEPLPRWGPPSPP